MNTAVIAYRQNSASFVQILVSSNIGRVRKRRSIGSRVPRTGVRCLEKTRLVSLRRNMRSALAPQARTLVHCTVSATGVTVTILEYRYGIVTRIPYR